MKVTALTGLAALTLFDISASTAQAQSFQGAYAGVQTGARWVHESVNTPAYVGTPLFLSAPAESDNFSSVSPLVGGHVGFNGMIGSGFLLGIEGDFDAVDNSSTESTLVCPPGTFCPSDGFTIRTHVTMGWQSTLRGRAGIVFGTNMVYGTGGLAISEFDWTHTISSNLGSPITTSQSEARTGWVVGGGYETFVGPTLIVRTEFLHEDFGTMTVPLADTTSTGTVGLTADKVRVGASFKF